MNQSLTRAYNLVYIGNDLSGFRLKRTVYFIDPSYKRVSRTYIIDKAKISECCGSLEIQIVGEAIPRNFFKKVCRKNGYHNMPQSGYFEVL